MRRRESGNGKIDELMIDVTPARVAQNEDGPWRVRRLILSRQKQAKGQELVKREIRQRFLEAADPELEWYIQVSVHSNNQVVFVGEVALPDAGDDPQEELDRLVARAHQRATFLNINCVELVGPPMIIEDSGEHRNSRRIANSSSRSLSNVPF